MDQDEEILGFEDAFAIAEKVIEMAERVRRMNKAVPGTVAKWVFELDDERFDVAVTVASPHPTTNRGREQ